MTMSYGIDPLVDPQGVTNAVEELQRDNAPRPVITLAPSIVTLPGGWRPNDSILCKQAKVRELTGEDEEALGRVIASAPGNITQEEMWLRLRRTILELGVESVGTGTGESYPISSSVIGSLFSGDVNALLLGIRIATWGPDWEGSVPCPGRCGERKDIIFELDKDIRSISVPDPYAPKQVKLRNTVVYLNRPTLADQEATIVGGRVEAEMNTVFLSRLLVGEEINTYPGGGMEFARKLGMKDRQTLMAAVADMDFGPQLGEVVVSCPDCNTEIKNVALSLPVLFR